MLIPCQNCAGFNDIDPLDYDTNDFDDTNDTITYYFDNSGSPDYGSTAGFVDEMEHIDNDSNAHVTYVDDGDPQAWLAPPTNLRWSATEPGVVMWDEAANATHYEMHIFHDDTLIHINGGTASVFSSRYGSPSDIILNGDLESGAYTFMVRSEHHTDDTRVYGEWSELSPVYHYTKPSNSLPAPHNLNWDLDDPATLNWTSAPGTRTYRFEVSRNGVPEFGTSYVDSRFNNGATKAPEISVARASEKAPHKTYH